MRRGVRREARERRAWRTLLSAGLVVVLLTANVLAAVNSYYGYFRTLGEALGVVRDLQPQRALDRTKTATAARGSSSFPTPSAGSTTTPSAWTACAATSRPT